MKTAVCDPEAFYPLRNLVAGPLNTLEELSAIERFIRTVVLHDEIVMELTPTPHDPETDFEFTEAEKKARVRLVITAIGPNLRGFDFFTKPDKPQPVPKINLTPDLIAVASRFANAGEGNVFFDTHIKYLNRVLGIVECGGSVLLCSDFGRQAVTTVEKYPDLLFKQLDEDWQRYAQSAQKDGLGLLVPPMLGIVLTRCARREIIPTVIQELRDEWAGARRKVWKLLDALRVCPTLGKATEIRRELSEASRLFSPQETEIDSRPVRICWEIMAAAAAGAGIAELSGGNPIIGTVTGTATQLARSVPALAHEFGPALFGRGAFNLANQIRHEVQHIEFDALSRLLTVAEKRKLGLE